MHKLFFFIGGILVGFALSWTSILIFVDVFYRKLIEEDEFIDELLKENTAYKKVVNKWKDEQDRGNRDYWG